jgi:hypothetical protein
MNEVVIQILGAKDLDAKDKPLFGKASSDPFCGIVKTTGLILNPEYAREHESGQGTALNADTYLSYLYQTDIQKKNLVRSAELQGTTSSTDTCTYTHTHAHTHLPHARSR